MKNYADRHLWVVQERTVDVQESSAIYKEMLGWKFVTKSIGIGCYQTQNHQQSIVTTDFFFAKSNNKKNHIYQEDEDENQTKKMKMTAIPEFF